MPQGDRMAWLRNTGALIALCGVLAVLGKRYIVDAFGPPLTPIQVDLAGWSAAAVGGVLIFIARRINGPLSAEQIRQGELRAAEFVKSPVLSRAIWIGAAIIIVVAIGVGMETTADLSRRERRAYSAPLIFVAALAVVAVAWFVYARTKRKP